MFGNWGGGDDKRGAGDLQKENEDLKKEIEKLRAAKASGSSFFAGSADAHPAASPAKPKPGSPAHASSPQQQSKPKLVGNASPSKSPGAASSSSPTHLGVYHKITPGDVLHVTGLNRRGDLNGRFARVVSFDPKKDTCERDEIRQRLYAPTKAAAAAARSKAIVTERAPEASVFESGLAADGVPVAIEERPAFQVPQGKRRSHTAKGKTTRDDKTNREKPRTFRGTPTTWAQKNRTSWEGRTTSPTGRAHPNRDRRNDVRKADLHNSINYYATARVMNKVASTGDPVYDAPDNDRKMNPASYVNSQAWFESLRHYPKGANAMDSEAAYSGLTHGPDVPTEHLETDVRTRMGIAVADPAWRPQQLQEAWAPEPPGLANRLTELRAKLRGVSVDHPDVAAAGSEHGPDMWA